jgi:hypothetical protein
VESPILRGGGSWDALHAPRRQKGSREERPRLFRRILVEPTKALPLKHVRGVLLWTSWVGSLEEEGWCAASSTFVDVVGSLTQLSPHLSLSSTKGVGDPYRLILLPTPLADDVGWCGNCTGGCGLRSVDFVKDL